MYAHINPVSGGVDRNHRYSARDFFFLIFSSSYQFKYKILEMKRLNVHRFIVIILKRSTMHLLRVIALFDVSLYCKKIWEKINPFVNR